MANESDLPQFSAGPTTPIAQVINPGGVPVAPKKAASGLLKRIMAHAKPLKKVKPARKSRVGRFNRRGLESDQKVHIKPTVRYY